ncbi:MAG: BatD family protein [Bacteroidales bacterium]|nr:BatD family protein [Bacteroidales bacterium]
MRYFWIVLFTCFFAHIQAQDEYTFEVKSPKQVAVGQAFDIQFVISSSKNIGQLSNFKAPTFRGLDIHFGPSQSQSSSTSIINGQRTHTASVILSYRVSAPKEGTINFGSASIDIAGKTYKTAGASIQVSKSNSQQQQGGQSNRASANAPQQQQPATISNDDLNLKASVSKRSAYEGEEILLTYTLFHNVNIQHLAVHRRTSGQGFWSETINLNSRPAQHGKGMSLVLEKSLIYPQHSGRLTIEPLEMEVIAVVQNRQRSRDPFADFFNDPFGSFFGSAQQVKKNISSNRVNIDVKPLPEKGKPASFRGNVGRFTFNSKIDKTTLKANEALTITVTIGGHGNLRHIEAPKVLFPADFEVYAPVEKDNIQVSEHGMTGSKTFEFLVIPKTQGSYIIPPIKFSYFDPQQGRYIEHKTEEFKITVQQGDERFMATAVGTAEQNRFLNRDIEFIKTRTSTLKPINQKFLFSTLFWVLFGLPFVLLTAFLIIRQQLDIRNADVVGLRNRRAFKEARKNLRKAEKFMNENNKNAFYIEISQALWGFLSKKFNIPVAELSIENVHQTLLGKQIQTEHIDQFLKALENCEFARFAPNGSSAQSMKEVYDEALKVISDIVRYLNE